MRPSRPAVLTRADRIEKQRSSAPGVVLEFAHQRREVVQLDRFMLQDSGGGRPLGRTGWTAWRIHADLRRSNCRTWSFRHEVNDRSHPVSRFRAGAHAPALFASVVPAQLVSAAWNGRHASNTPASWATSARSWSTTSTSGPISETIDEIVSAETGLCFGPDTLVEARNRGYTLATPGVHRRHRAPRA